MEDKIKEAAKIVLDYVFNQHGIYIGEYDATYRDEDFMLGISSMIEYLDSIAGTNYDNIFISNIIKSKEKSK